MVSLRGLRVGDLRAKGGDLGRCMKGGGVLCKGEEGKGRWGGVDIPFDVFAVVAHYHVDEVVDGCFSAAISYDFEEKGVCNMRQGWFIHRFRPARELQHSGFCSLVGCCTASFRRGFWEVLGRLFSCRRLFWV